MPVWISQKELSEEKHVFLRRKRRKFLIFGRNPTCLALFQDGDHVGFSTRILKIIFIDLVYHLLNVSVKCLHLIIAIVGE